MSEKTIEWGKTKPSEPFRFNLHAKPGALGRRESFELPNLNSDTLPWELIPFAILAAKAGPDGAKTGEALALIHDYISRTHPRLVSAIAQTGDHASEVLGYIIEGWVEHSGVDPKA